MRNLPSDSEPVRVANQLAGDEAQHVESLPNRLLTVREARRRSRADRKRRSHRLICTGTTCVMKARVASWRST